MLKNILSMFKEVIEKGNIQALKELNDLYEENDLEKLKVDIVKNKFIDMDRAIYYPNAKIKEIDISFIPLSEFEYQDIVDCCYERYQETYVNINDITPEALVNYFKLVDRPAFFGGKLELLKDLNRCLDFVENFKLEFIKISSPEELNSEFSIEDMNNPEFVKTFKRVCTLPPERWFGR